MVRHYPCRRPKRRERRRSGDAAALTVRRLEELDEIARGVDGEHLCATGAGDDLVAELHALPIEPRDLGLEVVDDEMDAVPASRPWSFPIGHRLAGRAVRAGQQEP